MKPLAILVAFYLDGCPPEMEAGIMESVRSQFRELENDFMMVSLCIDSLAHGLGPRIPKLHRLFGTLHAIRVFCV